MAKRLARFGAGAVGVEEAIDELVRYGGRDARIGRGQWQGLYDLETDLAIGPGGSKPALTQDI